MERKNGKKKMKKNEKMEREKEPSLWILFPPHGSWRDPLSAD